MGQKLLAYLFYGFLVLMVIAAIILLKYQLDHKDIKQQQIDSRANVVTHVETETDPKNTAQKQTDKNISESTTSYISESQTDTENIDRSLTYLDVYQQLQKAHACEPFFRQWKAKGIEANLSEIVRPAIKLFGAPDYLPNEQQPITSAQQTMLNQWQPLCQNLWHEYGLFSLGKSKLPTLKNDIPSDIAQLLSTLTAKTAKEIALKNTRKIAAQWQQSFNHLEQVLEGEDSLDEAQLMALQAEIKRLNELRSEFSQELLAINNPSEEEITYNTDQQITLYDQISEIEKQISAQKVVDKQALAKAETDFESHNQTLNKLLYGQDGDVFFEVLRTLEGHRYSRPMTYLGLGYNYYGKAASYRISPGQMVLEQSKWGNSYTLSNTLKYATHLYLCDLAWDCSSNSVMMLQYCLFGMYAYPDACGLDVRTFYQQHLVSANHMTDVGRFKNIYMDLFYE